MKNQSNLIMAYALSAPDGEIAKRRIIAQAHRARSQAVRGAFLVLAAGTERGCPASSRLRRGRMPDRQALHPEVVSGGQA